MTRIIAVLLIMSFITLCLCGGWVWYDIHWNKRFFYFIKTNFVFIL